MRILRTPHLLVLVLPLLSIVATACRSSSPRIDPAKLLGPWFDDGPSFVIVIGEETILYEFDMMEHAYRLSGDRLIIEFADGVQVKRIVRLTNDELVWLDETFGTTSVFYRELPDE